ncbi:MAG: acylphosphatase [Candidatus Anstonellales archaeon]
MIYAYLVAAGRVQGVFFRKYVCEISRKLFVNGRIWNEKDGTVRIQCECKSDYHLSEFIHEIKHSKPSEEYLGIRIDKLEIIEKKTISKPTFSSFEIVYH